MVHRATSTPDCQLDFHNCGRVDCRLLLFRLGASILRSFFSARHFELYIMQVLA